jgi:hypothetical protein
LVRVNEEQIRFCCHFSQSKFEYPISIGRL